MMRRAGKWLGIVLAVLVVAFLLLRTPDTDIAAMRAKYGAAPSQFVDLGGGLTVHLRDEGPRDAPVIMLLHGSNADLHTWEPWVKDLTRDFRVVRFDHIGHGLTGPNPAGDYRPAAFAQTVERVANKLGLERFVLAGNSIGGGFALTYALQHPERVTHLALLDPVGAPKADGSRGNIGFKIAATPGVNLLMEEITPRFLVEQSLSQTVTNQAVVTPAAVDRYWELLRYPGNRKATLARFALGPDKFVAAQLAAIKQPVLILWGEQDALLPVAGGRWFNQAIPGSKLIVYPGIGHLPQEEAAAQSVADLRAFLAPA